MFRCAESPDSLPGLLRVSYRSTASSRCRPPGCRRLWSTIAARRLMPASIVLVGAMAKADARAEVASPCSDFPPPMALEQATFYTAAGNSIPHTAVEKQNNEKVAGLTKFMAFDERALDAVYKGVDQC